MLFLDGGFASAAPAIAAFIRDHGAELPAVTFDALAAYSPSGVDRVVNGCEALYAAADQLRTDGLTLCAQLARLAEEHGFHALGQTARATGIIAAMRRRLGETETPDPADDPPANPDLIPPAE
jgi:hypothetical protein